MAEKAERSARQDQNPPAPKTTNGRPLDSIPEGSIVREANEPFTVDRLQLAPIVNFAQDQDQDDYENDNTDDTAIASPPDTTLPFRPPVRPRSAPSR